MKRFFCLMSIGLFFASCEYTTRGDIRNFTTDTLSIIIIKNVQERNGILDSVFFTDAHVSFNKKWINNRTLRGEYKLNPNDSIQIFGGLAPASSSKISFDTLIVSSKTWRESKIKISGRSNIFKQFKPLNKYVYKFDIEK